MNLADLSKEFPRAQVSWRAQTVYEKKALALAYIDARDVMARLDEVCGAHCWSDRYEVCGNRVICTLSVKIGDEWVSKSDGAGDTDVESEKGAISDAFKRAAVKWGIGRYLYDIEAPWVPCETNQNGKFKRFTEDPWKYVRGAPQQQPQQEPPQAGTPKPPAAVSAFWAGKSYEIAGANVPTLMAFADKFEKALEACPNADALHKLEDDNKTHTSALNNTNKTRWSALAGKLAQARKRLNSPIAA